MSIRSRGRRIALQVLYLLEWDPDKDVEGAIEDYLNGLSSKPLSPDDPSLAFARQLIEGVINHLDEIDAEIGKLAKNWRLDRMASVDRNILRLGTYELMYCPDIPPQVAINEAIELAKRFGTEDSASFVNGILDALMKKIKQKKKKK